MKHFKKKKTKDIIETENKNVNEVNTEIKQPFFKKGIVARFIKAFLYTGYMFLSLLFVFYVTIFVLPLLAHFIAETNLRPVLEQISTNKFWFLILISSYFFPVLLVTLFLFAGSYNIIKIGYIKLKNRIDKYF